MATGVKVSSDEVKPDEAEAKAAELLTVVNFSQSDLNKVGWLQFWIYMCNSGFKPLDKEYRLANGKFAH